MASALTTYFFVLKQWFLGAFAKQWKATISFVMFFCPSAWKNSTLPGQIFIKCYISIFFENMQRKFKFHYNLTIMTGTLHEDQYTFMILRCVIPVVLSNNKNKLTVHMCIVKNTTIFLIVRLLLLRHNYMFRPSMLAIFTPQTVNPPLTCRYSL